MDCNIRSQLGCNPTDKLTGEKANRGGDVIISFLSNTGVKVKNGMPKSRLYTYYDIKAVKGFI